jgi:hypothetical protein
MLVEENDNHVLLDDKYFAICAAQPITIDIRANPLRKHIKDAQDYNIEVSQTPESILCNSPRSITRGLEDWNLEDGLILYRGHIYVSKDNEL